ncbi:DUF1330 domain-containing protein [Vibrio spartinae]|uniref:DUF1330 domain-containing protein n=1 Tax=Vibrio spartinae TaxID=1918945 RepID=A0A1N6M811_9VIBR|nr:DUF1330 domain-containing protein [Vibrio spartinae]QMV16062.1 hypothetical protein Vspart_03445 [Vibrio spartinae]SIO95487.1 hypothetical protein VSP9026_03232 [Vibrio spartinae]
MTSLVIVDSTVIDRTKLAEYSALAGETLAPFNGRFIVKGEAETLHGEPGHVMKAIIEFPDKESAKNWYFSAAYQALIPLREQGIRSCFQLV